MNEGAVNSSTPADAPDWSAIGRDILCPLCDYNLRGLVEPRCPECGYRSSWTELLDRSKWEHEWLFEHQRGFKALRQTWLISLLPRSFWAMVLPTHTPRIRRLIGYWVLVISSFVAAAVIYHATAMGQRYMREYRTRQEIFEAFSLPPGPYGPFGFQRQFKSAQAAIDTLAPYSSPWQIWQNVRESPSIYVKLAGQLTIVAFAWPWLTVLVLLLFRATLRKARIRTAHVMRCAVYSSDALPLVLLGLLVVLPFCQDQLGWVLRDSSRAQFGWFGIAVLLAAAGIMTYRLAVAYTRYLRFPHAIWTAIAAQAIVVLAFLAASDWRFLI